MKYFRGQTAIFLLVLAGLLLFESCKSRDGLRKYRTGKDLSNNEVISKVTENQMAFESLYFKRMVVSLEENGSTKSVRANMFIRKDSAIIISVIPLMGIEVFRICLDAQSIRIIDRLNRKIIVSNYQVLKEKFFVEVDFATVQAVICNSLFAYPVNESADFTRYSGFQNKNYYSIISVDHRQQERLSRRNSDFTVHEVRILPELFKINEHSISNQGLGLSLAIGYKDFKDFKGTNFPHQVLIKARQSDKVYNITLDYNDIELNGSSSLKFRLPDNYEVTSY